MKRGYQNCKKCSKEVIRVVAKKRKGRCYDCWLELQREIMERKDPYFVIRSEEDLLNAAYQTAPWFLRTFGISLPAFLVRQELRDAYRRFKAKLEPHEKVWPFHFNKWSLARRKGFLVVSHGKPKSVWITELS